MATPVDEKISELTKLLGPEMMQDVLLTVIQKEKMAEQSGFVAKEAKTLDDMTPEEIIEYGLAMKERQEKEAKEKEAKESSMADEVKALREEMKGFMERFGKRPAKPEDDEEDEKKKEDEPVAAVTKEAAQPDPQTDVILKAINAQTTVLKELQGRVTLIEKAWQEAPPAIRSGGRPSQSNGNVLNGMALTEKEAQGQTNGMEGSYNGLIDFIVPKPNGA